MDLKERVLQGELMDAPNLDAAPHLQALKALQRVNTFSGTTRVMARALLRECQAMKTRAQTTRPIRILDLACGGGDVALGVARFLTAARLDVEIEAWDRSATAIEFAKARAARSSGKKSSKRHVRFVQHDIENLNMDRSFDVVMCTLFLHHLPRAQAVNCLSRMHRAASHCVLVDDLRRTRLGYRLAQLGCRVLTRSHIVHVDGPLSVRAAFTEREILSLSREAKLPDPTFRRHWPQRFLMRWERKA